MTGRTPVLNLALRLSGLAALALVAITCRDRAPTGPALPSQAALAVAPRLAVSAQAGGPGFFSIRTVHGVLTPAGGGGSYSRNANFIGDTATLDFTVTFPGLTQRYSLTLSATDTAGDTLFRSVGEVIASPGANAPVSEIMTYVAPDTAVRFLSLVPADSIILGGDTLAISAAGLGATDQRIAPLYIGWTSRDTSVANVISTGPSTGRVTGKLLERSVWIVGRTFNGVADSVNLRVALKVGSVVLAADTIHVIAGAVATTSARVLDALGAVLDRPVAFVSLDTNVARVTSAVAVPPLAQVLGIRAGTTKLVASSGGRADTAVIVVDPAAVALVRVIPDSIALNPGDSARFSVVALSAAGDTLTGRAVAWATADPKLITISAAGTITAVAVGRVAVIATVDGVVGTAYVNVLTTGTSIVRTKVSPKTLHLLALGAQAQLVAQGYAGDSSLVPGRYTWSVRQSLPLLAVDSIGGVTALAVGTAWVVATEKGGTADSAEVTVSLPLLVAPAAMSLSRSSSGTCLTGCAATAARRASSPRRMRRSAAPYVVPRQRASPRIDPETGIEAQTP